MPRDYEQDRRKDFMLKGAYTSFLQQTANSNMTFEGKYGKRFLWELGVLTRYREQLTPNTSPAEIPSWASGKHLSYWQCQIQWIVSKTCSLSSVISPLFPFPVFCFLPFTPATLPVALSQQLVLSFPASFPLLLSHCLALFHLLWTFQTFLRLRGSSEHQLLFIIFFKRKTARMFLRGFVSLRFESHISETKLSTPWLISAIRAAQTWASKGCWRLRC